MRLTVRAWGPMARRLGHLARERMLTLGELEIFGEPNDDRVSMLERMSMGTPARCHQPVAGFDRHAV